MISILILILNTLLLAFSISTDDFFLAFSYALSNPQLENKKKYTIGFIFSLLQFIAILAGWLVTDVIEIVFHPFVNVVPYLLLLFLSGVGLKLLIEGIYLKNHTFKKIYDYSFRGILLHGLTSCIDAYSLGITFTGYPLYSVFGLSTIVAIVTYIRSMSGIKLGKKVNGKIPFNAGIISGIIIILVAIEIFIGMKRG